MVRKVCDPIAGGCRTTSLLRSDSIGVQSGVAGVDQHHRNVAERLNEMPRCQALAILCDAHDIAGPENAGGELPVSADEGCADHFCETSFPPRGRARAASAEELGE